MKYDLSILIPSRNEMFLSRTIEDILQHKEGKTEVIAVIDGKAFNDELPTAHPDLTVVFLNTSIGQRAATNLAASLSKAKYLAKVDAHCSFSQGFDRVLMEDMQDNWTVVPTMKNLHAFDWVCPNGHRRYQGPSGNCIECGKPTEMQIIWGPRHKTPNSRSYCFDSEPHFQYNNEYTKRPEFIAAGDLTESMSLQGSFFMCTRKKYWELNLSGEEFGSWGSQGLEVAVKTWTSGGKVIVNNRCWYAHLFRTQGGDFSFPYEQKHSKVLEARKVARDLFFSNKWRKQAYPLSWLLERFWPVRGWNDTEYLDQKIRELHSTRPGIFSIQNLVSGRIYVGAAENIKMYTALSESLLKEGKHPNPELQSEWNSHKPTDFFWHVERFCHKNQLEHYLEVFKGVDINHPRISGKKITKGILYYTDGELDEKIATRVREQLLKANLPITSVSLKPLKFGNKSIHFKGKRGVLTMAKQILAGLEAVTEDIVYMAEHDLLYSPSHFQFTPSSKDIYFYNTNVYKLNTEKGYALKVDDCRQLSGMCAYRETLIKHYRKRIQMLEEGASATKMGYEPGTHNRKERVDNLPSETWSSPEPIIDIRHQGNLTKSKWKREEFINQKYTEGWTEVQIVPNWGPTKQLVESLK